MGAFLQVQGVSRHFAIAGRTLTAVDDVSFELDAGRFLSVVGPSGCGKTTLLRMIAGLIDPSSGEIVIDGHPVTGPTGGMGIVFQRPVLLTWRSVLSNVLLAEEIRSSVTEETRERARALLRLVGLAGFEDAYPAQLSGGMQHRVALCRALVTDPPLLLMDEPFSALDAITRERMGLLLRDLLSRTPKTVVFVTHGIAEAVFLSHDVIVMSSRPGHVAARFAIDLPARRDLSLLGTPRFATLAQQIREVVLTHSAEADGGPPVL